MNRTLVSSSDIRSIGYANSTLEVEFHNGGIYQYRGVPENLYHNLINASSHGSYFAKYIKNSFTPIKIS